MDNRFFEQPVLNSPYEYPTQYWELDDQGQPTQRIIESSRRAEFITPIPKPRKRKGVHDQLNLIFNEGKGLSTQEQQYDPTPIINELRRHVDHWRSLPNPNDRQVTPETARLLQHWRHHKFSDICSFTCQVETETTVILISSAPMIRTNHSRRRSTRMPGHAAQRHVATVRQTPIRADRHESDQPPWR